jgi:hypothetical protein
MPCMHAFRACSLLFSLRPRSLCMNANRGIFVCILCSQRCSQQNKEEAKKMNVNNEDTTSNDNLPPVSSEIDNSTKLIGDDEIGPYDVICGRDSTAFNNTGNRRFRVTISINFQQYVAATSKGKKRKLRSSVLTMMRRCGARFLKKKGSRWVDIGDVRALQKVAHALRDHIPLAKTTCKEEGSESPSDESSSSIFEKEYERRKTQSTVHEETPKQPATARLEEKLPSPAEVTSQNEEQHTNAIGETRIGADEADNILDILGSPPKKKKMSEKMIQTPHFLRVKPGNFLCRYEEPPPYSFPACADFRQESDRSAQSTVHEETPKQLEEKLPSLEATSSQKEEQHTTIGETRIGVDDEWEHILLDISALSRPKALPQSETR